MRRCLTGLVVTIAVVAAACSSSTEAKGPTTGSAWCKASQLEMRLVFLGFATGNVEGIVDVRNKGRDACDLSAYPAVQLLGAGGQPLTTHAYDARTSFFRRTPAPEVEVTLAAGSEPMSTSGPMADHAYIDLAWSDGAPPCEQPAAF